MKNFIVFFKWINLPLMVLMILLVSSNAYAHRVSVFAYVEGDKVFTESYFSKKKRVHQGKIEVFDSKNEKLLLSGTTDDEGNFNFDIPAAARTAKCGLHIVLHASEGHRGEWNVEADELFPESEVKQQQPVKSEPEAAAKVVTGTVSSNELAAVETHIKALDAKVETIKRMIINQQEKGPGVHEIFSGIGYILGLFGVAAFFASRKK